RTVRYDIRGFGDSTTEDVEFSNGDDLRAVLDAADARQVAVAGTSRGAMIAIDAILETPERFVACIWVGGGIGGYDPGIEPPAAEAALDAAWAPAEQARNIEAMADIDRRMWLDGAGQSAIRVPAPLREAFMAMDRPLVDPNRVFGKPTELRPPAAERLADLTLPTLVVVGELDSARTRAAAAHLATSAPNARLISWPDVAHMVGMEQPQRLAAAIADFLAPLPRWR
ncbi:MAG TPA: alpha/beta hydrolase, partial [Candidatus Binatus sp.]|nr:alpha/beta hydrolase [Candidatus Binatus sp.]